MDLNTSFLPTEPNNGDTALHLAACSNNEKVISHLLELGASPNVVDLKGRTPAMRAAEYGHIQVLKLLTDTDADLTGTFDPSGLLLSFRNQGLGVLE